MLTFGSLFTGIGGMDLGLERAGMVCQWQVEIDPFCQKVLAKHWPNVTRYGDVKNVTGYELEPVDLICGGFPCQPVSVAGKRKAQKDERWLWPEFARIIRAVKPRYVLLENVPGLLTAGMGDVLRDLSQSGYDAEWQMLSAAAYGAPHIRERVFILAYADNQIQPILSFNGEKWDRVLACNSREKWLLQESSVGGMDDGLSFRLERLGVLGNAVVPQVTEWIGGLIIEHNNKEGLHNA